MEITNFKKANDLQIQAYKLIENLDLVNITAKFGKLNIVGSAVYNLMTWRDVDFDLITNDTPKTEDYWQIVHRLFEVPGIKKLTLTDNRDLKEKNRPKSMYIGISYEDVNKEIWKLDIRILASAEATTDMIANLIKDKLTEETRVYILNIKSSAHDNPKYHKTFSSVDIYNAVLLENIKTPEEFKLYLRRLGKTY